MKSPSLQIILGALGIGLCLEALARQAEDPFGWRVFPGFYALLGLVLGAAIACLTHRHVSKLGLRKGKRS